MKHPWTYRSVLIVTQCSLSSSNQNGLIMPYLEMKTNTVHFRECNDLCIQCSRERLPQKILFLEFTWPDDRICIFYTLSRKSGTTSILSQNHRHMIFSFLMSSSLSFCLICNQNFIARNLGWFQATDFADAHTCLGCDKHNFWLQQRCLWWFRLSSVVLPKVYIEIIFLCTETLITREGFYSIYILNLFRNKF